jgi:sugar O-acyltransferase (sialic acid O-acetyltransferase NeuD family)
MTSIVIYGAGGHGREILEVIEAINAERQRFELLGFIDDGPMSSGAMVSGLPVLGGRDWLSRRPAPAVVVAIGHPGRRSAAADWLGAHGLVAPPIVHPMVYVSPTATLGEGVVVMRGSSVSVDVEIGPFANLNQMCIIGHDCRLGRCATLAGAVSLAGNVRIDEGAELGIGAMAIPGARVGAWATVGAGGVVVSDIPPNAVAVGVPAKVVRMREPGWQTLG